MPPPSLPPFPCSPVIRECSWKKTQTEKNMTIDEEEEFKVQERSKSNHNTRFSNKELYNKEIKAAEKEKCDTKNN